MSFVKEVLIVEDDFDDRDLLLEAIKAESPSIKVVFLENGLDALQHLELIKENTAELPCLILLDLNLPLMDGKETFNKIKEISTFDAVPIIVFTSSLNPNDREWFQSRGINFVTKPNHFSDIQKVVADMLSICNPIGI